MTAAEQRNAAKAFAEEWKGRGDEKGETARFWIELLENVFGVKNAAAGFIKFEERVKDVNAEDRVTTNFIDARIPSTSVLIEQKKLNCNLREPIRQSDKVWLTPFQQAKRYVSNLDKKDHPNWIVTCNFQEFLIYDMNHVNAEPESVLLSNLEKEYYRLQFLTDTGSDTVKKEEAISVEAARRVGLLYDALLKQYGDSPSREDLNSLNELCVRLVFCLYAEDAGIFERHSMFHDYLSDLSCDAARTALIGLFRMLDTPDDDRDRFADERLLAFPWVNGGLFSEGRLVIPRLNDEILGILLKDCSEDFDWSDISPTIFGATFESTLNPETRRSGGMHYTSVENIHKVIDPLFLDGLRAELEEIRLIKAERTRCQRALDFQEKLSRLRFFDPACGSGNFLTESYMSLRRLENEAIRISYGGDSTLGLDTDVKVSIGQFYGIEINDFAVRVARTALWIAESQMLRETEGVVHRAFDFLPLKTTARIVEGNALRLDWSLVAPKDSLNYIMGNPPFVGARLMDRAQKDDLLSVFGADWKNAGNLDYVACWYKKTCDCIAGTPVRAALVSTNSVTQGESVANLWKPLFESGVHIDFAHRTFRWDSEASLKAHVHCVIVGFSAAPGGGPKVIYTDGRPQEAANINAYLLDADNVFVESRSRPLCDVPEIGIGNKPIDGGNYLFTKEEMETFVRKEPAAEKWFRPWTGSDEFINRRFRYCLWLGDCPPNELRKMPECLKRVQAVREYRLRSPSAGTVKLADRPTRFHVENICENTYLLVPRVSSEKRRYIPIGFIDPVVLSSDSVHIIPDATLYHFGVLTSNVHMAWMRAVCGRLEMRYRYSKDVVYNNFSWPHPDDAQKARIGQTAQAILDARALYPDCSLADLYDELTMPPELRKAHRDNDRAVMAAYGFDVKMTESACVAALMKMYQNLAAAAC